MPKSTPTTKPASQSPADTLLLGTACRTINPPKGLPLIGYPSDRPNTGVALDLCARAAVFAAPGAKEPAAALIVLDTIAVPTEVVARIRAAAASAVPGLDPATVMVAATHTHSGPTLSVLRLGGQDRTPTESYIEHVLAQAQEAFAAAWKNRTPVTPRIGRAEARLGHNRRVVNNEGKAVNDWLDPEGRHTGFFNPNIRFMVFDDAQTGQPRALFSTYGCHPVTLGPGNTQASPDYPGHFCRAVEAALPNCQAFHFTAGAGNINPRKALSANPADAQPAGDALAAAVLQELPHARPVPAAPILSRSQTLLLPLAPDAHDNYSRRATDAKDGKALTSELQTIRLGDVALISTPGELFGELALAIENSSPFPHTLVFGYTNDSLGYLVTDTARREGGYEPRGNISHHLEACLLPTARLVLEAARAGA